MDDFPLNSSLLRFKLVYSGFVVLDERVELTTMLWWDKVRYLRYPCILDLQTDSRVHSGSKVTPPFHDPPSTTRC